MNERTLVLHFGAQPAGADFTHRDFAEAHNLAIVDNAELTYYVAQEATEDPQVLGKVAGSVQINSTDRKMMGAMVGNWVASGYVVNRMNHKQFTATVRKLQKGDAPTETGPATPGGEAGQPATPGGVKSEE